MTEPQFFARPKGLTAQEIAALTGAVARAGVALDRRITGHRDARSRRPGRPRLPAEPEIRRPLRGDPRRHLPHDRAVRRATRPAGVAVLVTPAPYRPSWRSAQALYPGAMRPSSLFEASGVSTGALVHPSARLESGVTIDPAAVIGPRAEIGAGTVIGPAAVIGPEVRIGRDCAIGRRRTIVHALIGDRVIIHAGVRIGQDGFGYLPGPPATARSRRSGASSSRTMSRSAPTRPSTAARSATP